MRTTLTLDPDVARQLEEEVHRQRKSFKEVVNDAIRKGLTSSAHGPAQERYKLVPHVTSLRAGVDRVGFNRLTDELEEGAFLDRPKGTR